MGPPDDNTKLITNTREGKYPGFFQNNQLALLTTAVTHRFFDHEQWGSTPSSWTKQEKTMKRSVQPRDTKVTGTDTPTWVGPLSPWSHICHRMLQECECFLRCRCQSQAGTLLLRWELPPLQTNPQRSSGGCGDWQSAHRLGYYSHSWKWGDKGQKQMISTFPAQQITINTVNTWITLTGLGAG